MPDERAPLDVPVVDERAILMTAPAATVVHIGERAVIISLPPKSSGLRMSRGVYEVYRRFHLPRRVGEVLSDEVEHRATLLERVRLLAAKGYLVPPDVGISTLAGDAGGYGR
jgi:hypothetical protein